MTSRAILLLFALLLPLAAALAGPSLGIPVPVPEMPQDGWLAEAARKKSAGDLPAALACFDQAVAFDPTDANPYWQRGGARLEAKDYHGAEADYSMVILLLPDHPSGYTQRANARDNFGAYPLALEDREAALALNPNDRELLVMRTSELIQNDRYREAVLAFNELLLTEPQDTTCLTDRALARLGLGDYFGAISDCDAVLVHEPMSSYAFQFRGLAKYHLGLFKGARHDFDSMVSVADTSDFSKATKLIRRSFLLVMIGDLPAALEDCEAALAVSDLDNQATILMQRSLLRQRLALPADEAIARALEQWKDEADLMVGRYLLGRVSEADLLLAADQADRSRFPNYRYFALYYAGMINLLQGREAHGLELLRQCAAFPSVAFEIWVAAAEVKRHGTK